MSDEPTGEDASEAEMALIEKLVDEAMEPWRDKIPANEHGWVRERLIEVLATHPNATGLISQLLRGPIVDVSGERSADGEKAAEERKRGAAK